VVCCRHTSDQMHAPWRYIKGIDRCRPYRFVSVSDRVIRAYRRELFGKSILQDLPDKPTFVFNATNLESGGFVFGFSKPYLADYRVGRVMEPDLTVAVAVAASSAFQQSCRRARLILARTSGGLILGTIWWTRNSEMS
jgi:hypothetical protein